MGFDVLNVSLGGTSGASGDGGDVSRTIPAMSDTYGDGSPGILLQSIGGGGGAVLTRLAHRQRRAQQWQHGQWWQGHPGAERRYPDQGREFHRRDRTVDRWRWWYVTNGITSFLGTAGGTGNGGKIDLTFNGSVVTEGNGSTAVFAQSVGKAGGDIKVALATDKYIVGGKGGKGVVMDGGASNTLQNDGSIFTLDGIDGMAVYAMSGNDAVYNNKYMLGDVDLGGGSNSFYTVPASLRHGRPGEFQRRVQPVHDRSTMAPGGSGLISTVATTNMNGSLDQFASGIYDLDLDFVSGDAVTGKADLINVSGKAALQGELNVNIAYPSEVSLVITRSQSLRRPTGSPTRRSPWSCWALCSGHLRHPLSDT